MLPPRLIELLDLPDTDYWYDVASVEASEILNDGGDPCLSEIVTRWAEWSSNRQEHLAYILEGRSSTEISLLEDMAKSSNKEVAYRAREALAGKNA